MLHPLIESEYGPTKGSRIAETNHTRESVSVTQVRITVPRRRRVQGGHKVVKIQSVDDLSSRGRQLTDETLFQFSCVP